MLSPQTYPPRSTVSVEVILPANKQVNRSKSRQVSSHHTCGQGLTFSDAATAARYFAHIDRIGVAEILKMVQVDHTQHSERPLDGNFGGEGKLDEYQDLVPNAAACEIVNLELDPGAELSFNAKTSTY